MTQEEYNQVRIDIENQKLIKLENINLTLDKININLDVFDVLCNLKIIEEVALNDKDSMTKKIAYLKTVTGV